MKQVITIGSVPHPITARHEIHLRGEYYEVIRKTGRQAWTFLLIERGRCRVDTGGKPRIGLRGHFYAIEPATPHQYGTASATDARSEGWTYYWAHVFPRPTWEPWLQWPKVAPGLRCIVMPEAELPAHLEQFQRVVTAQHSGHRQSRQLAMAQLEVLLILCDRQNPQAAPIEADDGASVAPAFEWIHANVNKNMTLDGLAHLCSMSRATFCRAFRAATGHSARDYIERRRIMLACQHLQLTKASVTEIAEQVGFRDVFYFSLRFKKLMDLSPLAFRKTNAPGLIAKTRKRKRRPTKPHPS